MYSLARCWRNQKWEEKSFFSLHSIQRRQTSAYCWFAIDINIRIICDRKLKINWRCASYEERGTFSGSIVNINFIHFLRPNYVYAHIRIESLVFSIDWKVTHTAYEWLKLFNLIVCILEYSLIVIGTEFRFPLRELIKKIDRDGWVLGNEVCRMCIT